MQHEYGQEKLAELILKLKKVFEGWKDLIKDKNTEQLTQPMMGEDWSIKDILAHLYTWQLVSRARLNAAIDNTEPVVEGWPGKFEPESKEELDRVNEWMYEESKDKTWQEVQILWEGGFENLFILANKVPVECWFDREKYEWLHGYELFAVLEGTWGHHQEHWELMAMSNKSNE